MGGFIFMEKMIAGRTIEEWTESCPIIEKIIEKEPVLWINPKNQKVANILPQIHITEDDMKDAEARWLRFAPLLMKLFPETVESSGLIESKLVEIPKMKEFLEDYYGTTIEGRMFLKCDSHLKIAGSVKARGGIYEVLKHAEGLAFSNGLLSEEQDYSILVEERFKEFFGKYSLAVGSTGNLGLSIGIMGSALGFKVTVHMSADAKEWKKQLLRNRGVNVIEYSSDYTSAVAKGRKQAEADHMCYFVDDENSMNLFLGYSVAAYRLKSQLVSSGISINEKNPLFVYIPCGVGGAPGGICFGLKIVFGNNVHCFFVEPTHSPSMILGLATGMHDRINVNDFGIDNKTEADGLAVATPSGFVGKVIEGLLSGLYTIKDDELFILLASLINEEKIRIEPSAAASLNGPAILYHIGTINEYLDYHGIIKDGIRPIHISWATGGLFVPENLMSEFYEKGQKLLEKSQKIKII